MLEWLPTGELLRLAYTLTFTIGALVVTACYEIMRTLRSMGLTPAAQLEQQLASALGKSASFTQPLQQTSLNSSAHSTTVTHSTLKSSGVRRITAGGNSVVSTRMTATADDESDDSEQQMSSQPSSAYASPRHSSSSGLASVQSTSLVPEVSGPQSPHLICPAGDMHMGVISVPPEPDELSSTSPGPADSLTAAPSSGLVRGDSVWQQVASSVQAGIAAVQDTGRQVAGAVRRSVAPHQRVVLLLGEAGAGKNYTASMLARVGDLKHCSLPDDADDADSNEPPELQLLQDNIPDPSSSSGERGTCAVEGPFPIQHHASHANRTSPMLLINTPGINDPKGEDLELIVKWGEGASEITRTTHVVYIYNAERALPNQYLVPYGTFIEPDQETGRARGLQVRAVCIRNSKTTGKDPAGLYRTLCRQALERAEHLGLDVRNIQARLDTTLKSSPAPVASSGGSQTSTTAGQSPSRQLVRVPYEQYQAAGIFPTHEDAHFVALWEYLAQQPAQPTLKIARIRTLDQVTLTGPLQELVTLRRDLGVVEARAAATAAALQRAQQALFVAGEELRDEEEHVRGLAALPATDPREYQIAAGSTGIWSHTLRPETFTAPLNYQCKGAGDVHLSNSTQQWAEERAGQQAGNQDDCWGFGRPSEGELSVVGGAEHYIRVTGDSVTIQNIQVPPHAWELWPYTWLISKRQFVSWCLVRQYICVTVNITWRRVIDKRRLRELQYKHRQASTQLENLRNTAQQHATAAAQLAGKLSVYQSRYPAVVGMVDRYIRRAHRAAAHAADAPAGPLSEADTAVDGDESNVGEHSTW